MNMKTIFIIGSGESNREALKYESRLRGSYVLAVNHAFKLFGNNKVVDAVFFKDAIFLKNTLTTLPLFKGLLLSGVSIRNRKYLRRLYSNVYYFSTAGKYGINTEPGYIVKGMCSGLTAINAAYHMAAREVILIGFDGDLEIYRDGAEDVAEDAKEIGLKIINTSLNSKIDVFKKIALRKLL